MPVSLVCRALSLSLLALAPLGAQTARTPALLDTMQFARALGVDLSRSERVASTLYRRELVVGAGAELRSATTATFRFRTVRADGTPVSASDAPVTVAWYPGVFVNGVERGVRGMRVGGRRQLVLAPGAGGAMPIDAAVVVEVELLEVS